MKAPATLFGIVSAALMLACALPLAGCSGDTAPGQDAEDLVQTDLDAVTDDQGPATDTDGDSESADHWEEIPPDLPETGPDVPGDTTGDVPDATDADADADADNHVDSDGDGIPDWREAELGTDPNAADSDNDGIQDGDELVDGTDPADPSDARAWHPELTGRPRLFFSTNDLPTLAARMKETSGATATIAARIRSAAAASLPVHPEQGFGLYVDRTRGQIAENAAFIALIENDQAMLDKAFSALIEGYVDPTTADLAMDSDYDLMGSESLAGFCSAWDMLAGNPAATPTQLDLGRAALARRIDDFRYLVHEGPLLPMMLFARNNHVIKVWAALGFCALSLNDRPEAAKDLSEAMTGIDWVFNRMQLTPDGGVAEGFHYLTYGSDTYLPLFYAWHRLAAGDTTPFMVVPAIQEDNPDAGRIIDVMDFARNPTTMAAYRLALESSTPDGLCTPTDDSNGAGQHGAILADMLDDPDFLWQWFKSSVGLDSAPLHVLSLIAYDGSLPPEVPDAALDFMRYDAGMAVLRESWDESALYLHLSGEHGQIRDNGIGHEHPDELSFLMWAFGRPLIIDPGYINYENHSLVFRPKDHNTILVDGVGSNFDSMSELGLDVGNDAFLSCIGSSGDFTWTAVTTGYEGVEFQRRIVRVRQDFFIVEDLINADDAHTYTFLLNGMGGGTTPDSSFHLTDNGAVWTNGGPSVQAFVLPLGTASTPSSTLEEHNAPAWGQWLTHERLAVEAVMSPDAAGFLTVVVPAADPESMPTVEGGVDDGCAFITVEYPGQEKQFIVSSVGGDGACPGADPDTVFQKGLTVLKPVEGMGGLQKLLTLPLLPTAENNRLCATPEAGR